MAGPEVRFDLDEQRAFDRAFPPVEVQNFEESGSDDWIGIFDASSAFDFPQVKPKERKKVVKLFLEDRHGSKIITKKTKEGLMVYKRNITPLLMASQNVFWKAIDYFTEDFKASMNALSSDRPTRSELDWQR